MERREEKEGGKEVEVQKDREYDLQNDGDSCKELFGSGKLLAIVYLLPLRLCTCFALIRCFPRCALCHMQHDKHDLEAECVETGKMPTQFNMQHHNCESTVWPAKSDNMW